MSEHLKQNRRPQHSLIGSAGDEAVGERREVGKRERRCKMMDPSSNVPSAPGLNLAHHSQDLSPSQHSRPPWRGSLVRFGPRQASRNSSRRCRPRGRTRSPPGPFRSFRRRKGLITALRCSTGLWLCPAGPSNMWPVHVGIIYLALRPTSSRFSRALPRCIAITALSLSWASGPATLYAAPCEPCLHLEYPHWHRAPLSLALTRRAVSLTQALTILGCAFVYILLDTLHHVSA
jgi:hypothetical protein